MGTKHFTITLLFVLACSLAAIGQENATQTSSYSLQELLTLAAQHNPTLKQAEQLILGEEGKAKQAGLWPNPTIGYIGEQIGIDGTAGEFQGGVIRQRIVTGGKLGLSRRKYEARADAARDNLSLQALRVVSDVSSSFYDALGATQALEIADRLHNNAKDGYRTTFELVNIGKLSPAKLRLAKVALENARLQLFMSENHLRASLASLEAVVGKKLGPSFALEGELETATAATLPNWEPLLNDMLENSPQILAALDKLESDKITVKREKREPIPDLMLEVGYGRNVAESENVWMAGVSLELPLFDRNQGTIKQAEADLLRQQAEVERLRLLITRDFSMEYARYLSQLQSVLKLKDEILPASRSAYEMQLEMYEASRANWTSVLAYQKEYFANQQIYVAKLVEYQKSRISLENFLAGNGLQPPNTPTPPSHIDSVPKPR